MERMAAGATVLRRRHCDEPVRRAGARDGSFEKIVHAQTGGEPCADGTYAAAPTDVNPELAEIARRVRARMYAEDAAVNGGRKAHVEMVTLGLGRAPGAVA